MRRAQKILLCLSLAAACAASSAVWADTLAPIHAFKGSNGGGVGPTGALLQGSGGHLYGATAGGGRFDAGTIFRIRADGTFETLTDFGLLAGSQPVGGLVEGDDGAFYGVTRAGGDFNDGVIFRMTAAGETTVLHSFNAAAWGGNPPSGLTRSSDGTFYGVLPGAGFEASHLYRITQAGEFSLISPLDASCTGYGEGGPLVEGSDGRLYGTASDGNGDCIFRASKQGGTTVLHRFAYGQRTSSVIFGSDGELYGTVTIIGAQNLCGFVYRFDSNRVLTTLHEFSCHPYRSLPFEGLVQGSDGRLRGTIDSDGIDGVWGSTYRIGIDGGGFAQNRLTERTGYGAGTLIQASDGNFYGNAGVGGRYGKGTVLRVSPTADEGLRP